MSTSLLALIVSTVIGVAGVTLIVAPPSGAVRPRRRIEPGRPARTAAGLGAGVTVLAFSGWVLPAAIVGGGAFLAVRSWQRRDRRVGDVEFTDALASWIENLRDVLIAGDQPVGAIGATVSTCPAVIRPAVRRLSASLGRQDPAIALRRFADDLDDPLGDLIASGLLIAIGRGARTTPVLTALAQQARQQADRRRILDAERAPIRREVGLLTLIMGALVVGVFALGRAEYLEPYDSPEGQLFLAIVLVLYAALLLRVQQLARFPRPSRFLTMTGAFAPAVAPTVGSAQGGERR
jgi:hypothetical protein